MVSVVADNVFAMRLVVEVRLLPEPSVREALVETLAVCNEAANWAAEVAFEKNVTGARALQAMIYEQVKSEYALTAQPALLVLSKVAGAYATLKANLKAGNYGKTGSKRRAKVEGKPVRFRCDAAQSFDDRCPSWQIPDEGREGTVSIWTTRGRLKGVRFVAGERQMAWLRAHRKGESDLVFREGAFYLHAGVEVPTPEVSTPENWLGIDMGIVNLAYTSDEHVWSGGAVTFRRKKNQHLRDKLQEKGTRSAKRLLKARRRKEQRFVRDINHKISHRIVTEAQRTGSGIAIEDLGGIRERARLRKPQRVALHTWAFAELGAMLRYKAALAGVAFVEVNPRYTSQRCSQPGCGHIEKKNRASQAEFVCRRCGTVSHADHNAARNIAYLAPATWEYEQAKLLAAGQKSPVHSRRSQ